VSEHDHPLQRAAARELEEAHGLPPAEAAERAARMHERLHRRFGTWVRRELIIQRNGQVFALDARPSDSIAVALRVDARIYAQESLLDQASVEIAEEEAAPGSTPDAAGQDPTEGMGPEELKEHLRKLNPEDFGRFTP